MLDKAEKFLIVRIGERHPEIPRSLRMKWAMNYNLEKENEHIFNSDMYDCEEDRAISMFEGMPEAELKTISLLMYKHRADKHGGDHEKRITELEAEISGDSELLEISTMDWWVP